MKNNVFICPPCGESVALATKEGQSKNNALWPLLPRLTAVLPPQGREIMDEALNKDTFRAPLRSGFTLIELLVVVLIIGILAAVAVPQYKKAVEKSRAATIFALVDAFHKAEEVYYLANGVYPTKLTELDVEMPGDWTLNEAENVATKGKQKLSLNGQNMGYSVTGAWNMDMDAYLEIYPSSNLGYCWANRNNALANQVCQSFSFKKVSDDPSNSRIGYKFK